MKDHTANIITKRLKEIRDNQETIENLFKEVEKIKDDVKQRELSIEKLSKQIIQMKPVELTEIQLSKMIDEIYDENRNKKEHFDLINSSTYHEIDGDLRFLSHFEDLLWLSKHFELDAKVIEEYINKLLTNFGEFSWHIEAAVNRTLIEILELYEAKGENIDVRRGMEERRRLYKSAFNLFKFTAIREF